MLDNALDVGIPEREFWDMTISEISRALHSKRRVDSMRMKERALMDWHLSVLIAKGYHEAKIPAFDDEYSFLFEEEEKESLKEKEEAQRMEISAIRFKQFADSFNAKFKEV